MKCPRCDYERQPSDEAPSWQCPSCKVAYVKAERAKGVTAPPQTPATRQRSDPLPVAKSLPIARTPTTATAATAAQPAGPSIEEIEEGERLHLAAHGQRMVIRSIAFNFILHAIQRSQAVPSWIVDVLFIVVAVYSLAGILKLCSGLQRTQNKKILCMVLSFLPLINIIMLVSLSMGATAALRAAGWRVGLFGAKMGDGL